MKNLRKSNPPKFWFWTGFVSIFVLMTIGILLTIFVAPNVTVFSVGDKKFTKSDVDQEIDATRQKAIYMGDDSIASKDNVKKAMIEAELIRLIAAEKGVTATNEEIETKLTAAQGIYKEEGFDATIDDVYTSYYNAYGYDEDTLREKIELGILREKLTKLLIANKEGRIVYTRFNSGNGVEEKLNLPSEKLEEWAKNRMDEYSAYLGQNNFDALYKMVLEKYGDLAPATGVSELVFNQGTLSPMTDEERTALDKLEQGGTSSVIKTNAIYVIYHLDKMSGGSYESWEKAIEDYTNRYVKKGFLSSTTKIDLSFLGIPEAQASCTVAACSGCDGSSMDGIVYDSVVGDIIPGATVTYASSKTFCDGSISSTKIAWCGVSGKTAYTDANGYYVFYAGYNSDCFANCGGNPFVLTAGKAGFHSAAVSKYPTNGYPYTQSFWLVPTFNASCSISAPTSVAVGQNFTGNFTATNTGAIRWANWAGFKLGSQDAQDNWTWGLSRVEMPVASVPVGSSTTFTINAKAPTTIGTYTFSWKMLREGDQWFGSKCSQNISVVSNKTVTYNGNGSTGGSVPSGSPYTVASGGSHTVQGNTGSLTKTGYNFNGWNTISNETGTSYSAGNTITNITSNITLYARWTPSKTITYNGNGSTGGSVPSGSPYTVASGGSHTVQGNTGSLTKTGYNFNGWNTISNETGTSYSAGNTITNITSNITLYARWTPSNVSCSVTPEKGLSPLVVKVEFSNGVPPYNLVMESGVTLTGRSTPVYFTYGSAGTKNITVSDNDSNTGNCTVSVEVTNPSDNTGGEVAP